MGHDCLKSALSHQSSLGASHSVLLLLALCSFSRDTFCLGDFFPGHLLALLLCSGCGCLWCSDKCGQWPHELPREVVQLLPGDLLWNPGVLCRDCTQQPFLHFWPVLFSSVPSVRPQTVLLCCLQAVCMAQVFQVLSQKYPAPVVAH